jgi:hypothetical protein
VKTTLVVLTSAVLLVGCGDSDNKTSDMTVPMSDAGLTLDGGGGGASDLSTAVECKKIGAWPTVKPTGLYDPNYLGSGQPATVAVSREADVMPWNELDFESWHMAPYPTTVTFTAGDKYGSCDTCVVYGQNCDATGCQTYFFGQAGKATVTQADADAATGKMVATASNLRLVEWDFKNDVSVDDTNCIEISSVAVDVSWANAVDGGGGIDDGGTGAAPADAGAEGDLLACKKIGELCHDDCCPGLVCGGTGFVKKCITP